MKTSPLHDCIVAMLAHVEERYDVRSVPEALIMMLTTADNAWPDTCEDIQVELTSWLIEHLPIDGAGLLLIELAERGQEYLDQIVEFDPDFWGVSGDDKA